MGNGLRLGDVPMFVSTFAFAHLPFARHAWLRLNSLALGAAQADRTRKKGEL